MGTSKHRNATFLLGLLLGSIGWAWGQAPSLSTPTGAAVRRGVGDSLPDSPSFSQNSASSSSQISRLELQDHPAITIANTPMHGVTDLAHIAVSPIYLRGKDLKWFLPLTGATIAAFATDTTTMTDAVSRDPSFNQTSANVSDGLRDGLIALPVAMFGFGQISHREHMRETGILGGEAMVDALVVDEVVKLGTFRERPLEDNSQGEFYIGKSGGVNSSFVSGHSMIAWSSAAVVAGEYRSRWMQLAVYSAAAGVSVARVTGQQHFPSDVLLGSVGGWLIGHYVYRAHHHADVSIGTK